MGLGENSTANGTETIASCTIHTINHEANRRVPSDKCNHRNPSPQSPAPDFLAAAAMRR
jgi:hypothetical protein